MDVREKLVELIKDGIRKGLRAKGDDRLDYSFEDVADNLIRNGVTVQEWYFVNDYPKKDGTYLVQTNTGTITTARFYAFKSFPATKHLPACHRSASWQSNRNVVKWTFLPHPPKGE